MVGQYFDAKGSGTDDHYRDNDVCGTMQVRTIMAVVFKSPFLVVLAVFAARSPPIAPRTFGSRRMVVRLTRCMAKRHVGLIIKISFLPASLPRFGSDPQSGAAPGSGQDSRRGES